MNVIARSRVHLGVKGDAASNRHAGRGFFAEIFLAMAAMSMWAGAASGAEPRTVVIGFTASQTGSLNVEGIRQINGVSLWVDDVNAAGGIPLADGTKVKVAAKFYDDESNKSRVQELYTRLISGDKADFLISPYSSGLTDAAAVIAEQTNKIMITAGAASDSTYKKGFTLVYQTYTPASRYLTGAVDLLMKSDPGSRKLAIVNEKDKFSADVVAELKKYAESKGFQIVMFEGYDTGTADFAPFINKIPADADAIMGGGHFSDTSTFARQLYEKSSRAKMVALLVAPPEPRFAELGEAAAGVIGSSQWEPAARYSKENAKGVEWYGPAVADFEAGYQAKFHEEPSYHSAGGYAAGLLLEKAIRNCGSTDTGKVKAALDAMDIMTFYGRLSFVVAPASHGLQKGHEMIYIQWQRDAGGSLVKQLVWPEDTATAGVIPMPKR
jgi:branched-chain amino acid transport system substrate-binding protein